MAVKAPKAVFAPKSMARGKVMAMSATTDDIIEKMKTLTVSRPRNALHISADVKWGFGPRRVMVPSAKPCPGFSFPESRSLERRGSGRRLRNRSRALQFVCLARAGSSRGASYIVGTIGGGAFQEVFTPLLNPLGLAKV